MVLCIESTSGDSPYVRIPLTIRLPVWTTIPGKTNFGIIEVAVIPFSHTFYGVIYGGVEFKVCMVCIARRIEPIVHEQIEKVQLGREFCDTLVINIPMRLHTTFTVTTDKERGFSELFTKFAIVLCKRCIISSNGPRGSTHTSHKFPFFRDIFIIVCNLGGDPKLFIEYGFLGFVTTLNQMVRKINAVCRLGMIQKIINTGSITDFGCD
mmetsp:Transcript_9868/g.13958  ORF Transcript_9868/g.13958 Transcript_9868/m.13958 type:complete len:209 (-) Transcript_9868:1021-1647(-)